jgi:hypothetical protein
MTMGRQLVGSLMYLGLAIFLFEIAGRLALEQRTGWGWFVFAGLMLSGIALNLWTGEISGDPGKGGQKPNTTHDLG